MSAIPPISRAEKRIVLVLRLWAHEQNKPVWIGDIQDVSTGETIHVQSLEALFGWLKQRTASMTTSNEKFNQDENTLVRHQKNCKD